MNKLLKSRLTVFLSAIVFGVFAVWQYQTGSTMARNRQEENGELLAIQVSHYLNEAGELRASIKSLEERKEKLGEVANSAETAEEALNEAISEYTIFSGRSPVSGPGVIINISRRLEQTELVDLVNVLRSLGAEAISINNERIIESTAIDASRYGADIKVMAIGSQTVLYEGLTVKYGIIEQINKNNQYSSVERVESITLPEAKALQPKLGVPKDT